MNRARQVEYQDVKFDSRSCVARSSVARTKHEFLKTPEERAGIEARQDSCE